MWNLHLLRFDNQRRFKSAPKNLATCKRMWTIKRLLIMWIDDSLAPFALFWPNNVSDCRYVKWFYWYVFNSVECRHGRRDKRVSLRAGSSALMSEVSPETERLENASPSQLIKVLNRTCRWNLISAGRSSRRQKDCVSFVFEILIRSDRFLVLRAAVKYRMTYSSNIIKISDFL